MSMVNEELKAHRNICHRVANDLYYTDENIAFQQLQYFSILGSPF